jgi:hypothetical protein
MTVKKSIEFFAPYIANTFNEAQRKLAGVDGRLSGGVVTIQTATTVDIAPYVFIQNGVIVEEDAPTLAVTVPDFSTEPAPIHIIVSSPDEKDTSGITVTVSTGSQSITSATIVLASRNSGVWSNPAALSLDTLRENSLQARTEVFDGRIEDATVDFDTDFGTNQGVRVSPGIVSEPTGERRSLLRDSSLTGPPAHVEFDVTDIDTDFVRDDHVVLRKFSDDHNVPAEMVLAKGGTYSLTGEGPTAASTAFVLVDGTAGNSFASVADNAAGQHVVVWGNGNDLKLSLQDHTTGRAIVGGISTLAMGGAVKDVYITAKPGIATGDRLYGVCSVGAVGAEEIFIFRTAANGTALDATTVALTTLTNAGLKPHMVIDSSNFAHITFQHDESGGQVLNQIYYSKYNLADATWNTGPALAVSPRFANGFNTGKSDTDPRIDIGPDGRLHIAWITGNISATVGEVAYLVSNDVGAVVEARTIVSADTGNGAGAAAAAISTTDNIRPRVAVSPQNDVYVTWVADQGTGTPYAVVFEPALKARTGFTALEYNALLITGGAVSDIVAWHDAFTDDLGRLHTVVAFEDTGLGSAVYEHYVFNPVLAANGVNIVDDILTRNTTAIDAVIQTFVGGFAPSDPGRALLDRDGSLQIVANDPGSSNVRHYKYSSGEHIGSDSVATGATHPRDTYLGTASNEAGTGDIITTLGTTMRHSRKIGSKSPFTVVGDNGDFTGFHALHHAINSLKGIGGKVIVSGGYYRLAHIVRLWPGIELIADGHVVLDMEEAFTAGTPLAKEAAIVLAGSIGSPAATVSATDRRFDLGLNADALGVRSGDAVYLFDDSGTKPVRDGTNMFGPFFVVKVDKADAATGHVILNRNISTDITGMTTPKFLYMPAGNRIEGFTLQDDRGGRNFPLLRAELCYKPIFEDLRFETADADPAIRHSACVGARYKSVWARGDANSMQLDGITEMRDIDTFIDSCNFIGAVLVGNMDGTGFQRLQVSGSNASAWTFSVVTDNPVWTNNGGTISGTTFDAQNLWGKDATVFMENIRLSQTAGALAKGHVLGSMLPTATGTDMGSATKRWDAFVQQLNLYGDLIPDATGVRALGSFAKVLSSVFSKRLDVSPTGIAEGWVGSSQGITDQVSPATHFMNLLVDSGGVGSVIMEANGRLARPHRLFDDFVYDDTKWTTPAQSPQEYTTTGGVGSATLFLVPPATDLGGVVEILCDGTNNMALNTGRHFLCRPTLNRRINAYFRAALNPSSVNSVVNLQVANTGVNKTFGFNFTGGTGWRAYTEDVAGIRTFSAVLFAGVDGTFYNFHIRTVDDNTVEFWASGGGGRVAVTAPQTFTSIGSTVGWGLTASIISGFVAPDAIRLDAWEIQETRALGWSSP